MRLKWIIPIGVLMLFSSSSVQAAISIGPISNSAANVAMYDKFESSFNIAGSTAENYWWPYDASSVLGLVTGKGITVDGLFLPPGEIDWNKAIVQPAFYYQPTITDRTIPLNINMEWIYPTGSPVWKLRFTPTMTGTWSYRIRVQDASNSPGWTIADGGSFLVGSARTGNHGFIGVSKTDWRYFVFSDGSPFTLTGMGGAWNAERQVEGEYQKYSQYANFVRPWLDNQLLFSRGTHGWTPWFNADDKTSVLEKYKDHDFSVKLTGAGDFISQSANDNQYLAGGLENNKTYKARLRVKLAGANAGDLVVKLISDYANWNSDVGTLAPSAGWNTLTNENGWLLLESKFTNAGGRFEFVDSKSLAVGLKGPGTVYLDEIYIGENLGPAITEIGPNVVFKGQLNYHTYFDQIAAGNIDRIVELSEKYGVYLKPVISDKEDRILTRIRSSDGVYDPTLAVNGGGAWDNFHSARGNKSRRIQEYYWRYLAARWGYSTAIHSWELLNEGDPGRANHQDQADDLAETINKYDPNHMATTSFWSQFPYTYWAASPTHYADLHAYVSTSYAPLADREKMQYDTAYYHIWHSIDAYYRRLGKPMIRGEAGIDYPTYQDIRPDLALDTAGVWFHNYTWAQLHYGGLYEIYWWYNDIKGQPGPDGLTANGLFETYTPFRQFLSNINLASGNYQNISAYGLASGVDVVGQKDTKNAPATHAHLWIYNLNHTWWNVINKTSWGRLSGSVTISGFVPSTSFPIEWWDFNNNGVLNKRSGSISSDSQGVINLDLNSLSSTVTDTAVKIGTYNAAAKPGDANGDGKVDGVDYTIWLNHYNQNVTGTQSGDFDANGHVDGLDYVVWLNNYMK